MAKSLNSLLLALFFVSQDASAIGKCKLIEERNFNKTVTVFKEVEPSGANIGEGTLGDCPQTLILGNSDSHNSSVFSLQRISPTDCRYVSFAELTSVQALICSK